MNSEVGVYSVPKYMEMLLSATAVLIETIEWQAFARSARLDAKQFSTAWRGCYMTIGCLI